MFIEKRSPKKQKRKGKTLMQTAFHYQSMNFLKLGSLYFYILIRKIFIAKGENEEKIPLLEAGENNFIGRKKNRAKKNP